jgi:uncharacterized protein (TIGR02466 family)
MNFEIHKIFPEAIAFYELSYNKKEEEFLKQFQFTELNTSINEDLGGKNCFISKELYVLNKNNLLKNKLLKCVNHFINELGLDFKLKVTTSWLTKTLPKGFTQEHNHSLSFYSAVYYPFQSTEKYEFEFMKKKNDFWELSGYVKHYNHINNKFKVEVNQNTLIIFNSNIKHRIPKNNTKNIRYSLAFNTMPIGFVGDKNSDSQFKFKQ